MQEQYAGEEVPCIELENVCLKRPHFELGPISLQIPKGHVVALVGPNGSGKSTLIKLLLEIIHPDKGELRLFGAALDGMQAAVKQQLAYVAEQPAEDENSMRAAQKTAFVRAWYPSWDERRYRALLATFDVNDQLRLGKMSKGMRQKFELCLALAHQPQLLLLDEPSSGLDPLVWRRFIELLHQYMETGDRTVVIATHILEEVRKLADYVVFMANGRILGMFEKDSLLDGWRSFYIQEQDASWEEIRSMPGFRERERVGARLIKAVSSEALQAGQWLAEAQLQVETQKPLTLDEIMAYLVAEEKQQQLN